MGYGGERDKMHYEIVKEQNLHLKKLTKTSKKQNSRLRNGGRAASIKPSLCFHFVGRCVAFSLIPDCLALWGSCRISGLSPACLLLALVTESFPWDAARICRGSCAGPSYHRLDRQQNHRVAEGPLSVRPGLPKGDAVSVKWWRSPLPVAKPNAHLPLIFTSHLDAFSLCLSAKKTPRFSSFTLKYHKLNRNPRSTYPNLIWNR